MKIRRHNILLNCSSEVARRKRELEINKSSPNNEELCQFVILNSNDEWLYYNTSTSNLEFTSNSEHISVFTLTLKGNIICFDNVIVVEFGIDNMHIVSERSTDCTFSIDGHNRILCRVKDDNESALDLVLTEDLIFCDCNNGLSNKFVRIEYVSNMNSFSRFAPGGLPTTSDGRTVVINESSSQSSD